MLLLYVLYVHGIGTYANNSGMRKQLEFADFNENWHHFPLSL